MNMKPSAPERVFVSSDGEILSIRWCTDRYAVDLWTDRVF